MDVLATLSLAVAASLRLATPATVAVVATPDEYVVTGRFVLPAGESTPAIRRDRVFGRIDWSHGNFGSEGSLPIDWPVASDGSFRALVPRQRASVVLEFWFELRDEEGSFESGIHVGMPLNEETGEPDSDRVELGELPFPVSRTIAAGRVVDRAGLPIAGAHISVEQDFRLVNWEEGERPTRNPALRQVRARSAKDGSFRIRAPFEIPDGLLEIAADGYFDEKVELPSVTPCDVRLVAKARIPGRVEYEKFDGQHALYAEINPRDGSSRACRLGVQIGSDGAFAFEDVRPATYDLVIRVEAEDDAQPEILAAVDGIDVKEGVAVEDERLQKLSFQRRRRSIHVRYDLPESTDQQDDSAADDLVPCGELLGIDGKGRRTVWSADVIRGEATVRPLVDVERLELRVDGFRTERIDDLSRDATLRLRRGIPVKLVVLPERLPCLLSSTLTPVGGNRVWYRRDSVSARDVPLREEEFLMGSKISVPGKRVDGDEPVPVPRPGDHPGVLEFALGDPGRFELRLRNASDDTLIPIPRESAVIDVKDLDELQAFEIHLDPDVVKSLRND